MRPRLDTGGVTIDLKENYSAVVFWDACLFCSSSSLGTQPMPTHEYFGLTVTTEWPDDRTSSLCCRRTLSMFVPHRYSSPWCPLVELDGDFTACGVREKKKDLSIQINCVLRSGIIHTFLYVLLSCCRNFLSFGTVETLFISSVQSCRKKERKKTEKTANTVNQTSPTNNVNGMRTTPKGCSTVQWH
jgi:hypothetical protein